MCKEYFTEQEIAEEYFERGRNYVILEKYSEAIEDLTKVIEFFPPEQIYRQTFYGVLCSRGRL